MGVLPTRRVVLLAPPIGIFARSASAAGPLRRVAIIASPYQTSGLAVLEDELRWLGYSDGGNIDLDVISTTATPNQSLAKSVKARLARGAQLIVAGDTAANLTAALTASNQLPIVLVAVDYDPVAKGYVTNLAQPDNNITGVVLNQNELIRKRLQLLRRALPEVRGVLVLCDPTSADQAKATEAEAVKLGLSSRTIEFRNQPYEYEQAIDEAEIADDEIMITMLSPVFFADRKRLTAAALARKLPTMWCMRQFADSGGLLAYGANVPDMFRRGAHYVDRLLRGAQAGDLPIEETTGCELVINRTTARALGLAMPQSLVARADAVIE